MQPIFIRLRTLGLLFALSENHDRDRMPFIDNLYGCRFLALLSERGTMSSKTQEIENSVHIIHGRKISIYEKSPSAEKSNQMSFLTTDLLMAQKTALDLQSNEWLTDLLNRLPVPLILVEEDLKGFTYLNVMAKEILQKLIIERNAQNSELLALSFETHQGEVIVLSELLKQVDNNKNPQGFEAYLVLKDKKIPVQLFSENLPARLGKNPAKLLIFQDVSNLKNIQQAQLDLSQALRGRDQFMAALSHELRTPLNVILGWVQLLRANPHDDLMTKQALDILERNAELQRSLIEDLLDMSRIIAGNIHLQKKPLDLKSAVRKAINPLFIKADEKKIDLQIKMTELPVVISADDQRIQQLVFNLIQNAIKFTPVGGTVTLNVSKDSETNQAHIDVSDNGQGINREFLPYVFDQFKQENMSTSRSYGGLGLGLAICKTIVEMHKGEITAHSEGYGLGAKFSVHFPLSLSVIQSQALSKRTFLNKAVDLKGLRVLVVDDSKDNLLLFRIWLKNSGADTMTLDSAKGVIEAIDQYKPHVLLSDISMPDEDGYALITKVRALSPKHGGRIPAGAVTANARIEDRELSIEAGYHMHIPKPVTANSLVNAVKSLSQMAFNAMPV